MHQLAAEQSQQLTRQNKSLAMYCSSKIMDMLTFHFLRFNFWVKRQKKTKHVILGEDILAENILFWLPQTQLDISEGLVCHDKAG